MTSDHACFSVPQPHFAQNQAGSDRSNPRERFGSDLLMAEENWGNASEMTMGYAGLCKAIEADPSAVSGLGSAPNHRLRSTPLTPQTWQEAEKLAKLLCKSKLVPPGFESPDLCLIAILQGLEMGLPPMMALQRMALIEGKLTLWGDGALALVLRSGLCTSITEWMGLAGKIGDGQSKGDEDGDQAVFARDLTFDPIANKREDDWVAFCEVTRAGWDKPVRRSFSTQDAKRANLWKKEGPWLDYPKRMLQMRARAFALRDAFADVLGGLYVREEIEPKGSKANASNTKDPTTRNSDQNSTAPKNTVTRSSDPRIPDPEKLPMDTIAAKKTDAIASDARNSSVNCSDTNEPQRQHGQVTCSNPQENPTRQPPISNQSLIWGKHTPVITERRKAPAPPAEATNCSKVTNPGNIQKIHAKALNGGEESVEPGKSHENAADAGKADLILREFKRSLRNCLNLADLDACRLKFQPSLDLIAPESLDQAAQLYLEQEARIEAPLKPHAKLQSAKKCKPHPQIRRWKAQYRPYQHQNRQKQAHKTGFELESILNDGPD